MKLFAPIKELWASFHIHHSRRFFCEDWHISDYNRNFFKSLKHWISHLNDRRKYNWRWILNLVLTFESLQSVVSPPVDMIRNYYVLMSVFMHANVCVCLNVCTRRIYVISTNVAKWNSRDSLHSSEKKKPNTHNKLAFIDWNVSVLLNEVRCRTFNCIECEKKV